MWIMVSMTIKQIEELAMRLPASDRLALIQRLLTGLPVNVPTAPKSLRGAWRSAFPADFDIDGAVRDIRHEWMRDEAA
jgi:hypothetical protein